MLIEVGNSYSHDISDLYVYVFNVHKELNDYYLCDVGLFYKVDNNLHSLLRNHKLSKSKIKDWKKYEPINTVEETRKHIRHEI